MKFPARIAVTATIFSSLLTAALAEDRQVSIYFTGDVLTKYCRTHLALAKASHRSLKDQLDGEKCMTFAMAVADALAIEGGDAPVNENLPRSCVPASIVKAGTLADVVANFLAKKPELHNRSGYELVRLAFADKFPCN
jgi:hypothetical protein